MSKHKTPHVHPVDEAWLALGHEEPIDPDVDIVDSHIHLWTFSDPAYLCEQYEADARQAGISASIYVDCTMGYREDGPVELEPVGEVEFARAQADRAQGDVDVGAAIVGWADLSLGDAVAPVLAAEDRAGGGRFRGVRARATYDPDPQAGYGSIGAPAGLLGMDSFRRGVACVQAAGQVLDLYAFHTQLGEVADLARAFPDLPIVLNHIGGPLGIGPYAAQADKVLADWRDGMSEVSGCSNVSVKIGGFAIARLGIVKAVDRSRPVSSEELADICRPWVDHCLDTFGADRCMFASNFPVDKAAIPMGTLVNGMKRLVARCSPEEQALFFAGNARAIYGL